MGKNLIIGGFTNYTYNQLKPWVLSAKEVIKENDDIVLCVGSTNQETIDWLEEQGVILVPMMPAQNIPIHVSRFISIYDHLSKTWDSYNYIVTTDVKDVYFQTNPFDVFEKSDTPIKLLVASEGMYYKDEPWGNDNLMQSYGPYVYEKFCDNEIYNVGTFGGTSEYVKDMIFNIFTNAINRPIPICDQAVFNVLVNTQPFKDVIHKTRNWACEAGTVADPTKIEQFRPKLVVGEPIFEDGLVKNPDGSLFSIVHQYDRVPEWKEHIGEKYNQEDDSPLFVYRTA